MVYARVHNQTVAEDYLMTMERVEQRLSIGQVEGNPHEFLQPREREQVLQLVDELAQPDLDTATRVDIAAQLRSRLSPPVSIAVVEPG